MMKTILVVLGLTAVLFSGILAQVDPSPSPTPPYGYCTDDDDCGGAAAGYCNMNTSMCECNPGYTGTYCEDVDECYYEPCDEMYTCYNVHGSYFCACNGSDGSGSYCEELPVKVSPTTIPGRGGCYPGDVDHYIEGVKNAIREILREIRHLGLHS